MHAWMNVGKKDWKIRENRGSALSAPYAQSVRHLTGACAKCCAS